MTPFHLNPERDKRLGPASGPARITVIVRDNGGGISPLIRDKVFSPFCTTKAKGMGLGLPIVKRTVIDHSGDLAIESSPGGTSVSLSLPATGTEDLHETYPDRR